MEGGRYRVRADAYLEGSGGYFYGFYGGDSLESASEVAVQTGGTASGIDIVIGDNAFEGSISGEVTANGAPQAGIEVGLFQNVYPYYESAMPFVTTMTDAQGHYKLEGLGYGYYQVGFRDPQGVYATTYYTNSSELFNSYTVWVTETSAVENINAELSPGGTIRGKVLTQNGKQRGGFIIQLISANLDPYSAPPVPYLRERSDTDGSYEITGLIAGSYFLRAISPIYSGDYPSQVTLYYPGDFYPWQPITIESGETLEDMDFFVLFTPNYFLPVIGGGVAESPSDTPLPPIGEPWPQPPFPQPIPTATPAFP
jgi:hypothetical protein